ncbi:MAG TPA: hypothetical protein PKA56_00365 [Solirubrobacterales bacterium]|jgi:hypothetical protein|nr:hypothetical protein [Solirubrobacterales bacterium]HMU26797.1 hypothetical protein [Solirubrobacterales bacterium]HMW44753.1 hypothetical protein [Solirubrobacterales bacterium]HMX70187.1 hypothetical protein [Solirubrobacterales bacterium]HMY26680.1 hypothetical protein [Solirubrobacterales bacterium]
MEQKVEGSTETRGSERLGWKGLFTNHGPKFEVSRLVHQIVFGLFLILGFVPVFLMSSHIHYPWNASFLEELAPMIVFMVYGAGLFSGAGRFTRWLFGPMPKREPYPTSPLPPQYSGQDQVSKETKPKDE